MLKFAEISLQISNEKYGLWDVAMTPMLSAYSASLM
jgi:hypothetical protein